MNMFFVVLENYFGVRGRAGSRRPLIVKLSVLVNIYSLTETFIEGYARTSTALTMLLFSRK